MESEFIKSFKAARRVSTPLVAVRTADPASAVQAISAALNGTKQPPPMLMYDLINGLRPLNSAGKAEATRLLNNQNAQMMGTPETLAALEGAAEDVLTFFHSRQRFWTEPAIVQATWNLRDGYKSRGAMLVILMAPGAPLPADIASDVLMLDEPLPGIDELRAIVTETAKAASLELTEAVIEKAVDALLGLSAFVAEQTFAMCLSREGVDQRALWNRKCSVIEQTPGLSVYRGTERLADLGGLQNIKNFLMRVGSGKQPPRAILFFDEIEKGVAGTGTDTSGSTTKNTGTLLTWTQNRRAKGILCLGVAGGGKSALAKAFGNELGIPTIIIDMAAMEAGIVGQSNEQLRAALAVVDAIAQGRVMMIATCNSLDALPPELRRRFRLGTFFFDLLSATERKAIWAMYMKKYELDKQPMPDDTGWTGAEIENACELAWSMNITLKDAAQYVVPVAVSASEQIKKLRQDAAGKFISASEEGTYSYADVAASAPRPAAPRRFVTFDDKGGQA